MVDGNLLSSPGAEELVGVVTSNWNLDNGSSIVSLGADKVFRLSSQEAESTIYQSVSITNPGSYTLYFR